MYKKNLVFIIKTIILKIWRFIFIKFYNNKIYSNNIYIDIYIDYDNYVNMYINGDIIPFIENIKYIFNNINIKIINQVNFINSKSLYLFFETKDKLETKNIDLFKEKLMSIPIKNIYINIYENNSKKKSYYINNNNNINSYSIDFINQYFETAYTTNSQYCSFIKYNQYSFEKLTNNMYSYIYIPKLLFDKNDFMITINNNINIFYTINPITNEFILKYRNNLIYIPINTLNNQDDGYKINNLINYIDCIKR